MKTLFTDLYNKILEIFQRDKSENTSGCAVDRLQVILMHDRTKLDPLIMNKMREELIDVFSKYVVIDKEKLEIDLTNEGDAAALMLNIPIIRAKTEEELEEIRKQLQEQEEKVDDSDDEDSDDNEEDEKSEETEEEEDSEEEIIEEAEYEIIEEKEEITETNSTEEKE
ncbi:MAG: cell division topological specificity factor MinE [Candidatus Avigastranaerophilus sp.]